MSAFGGCPLNIDVTVLVDRPGSCLRFSCPVPSRQNVALEQPESCHVR